MSLRRRIAARTSHYCTCTVFAGLTAVGAFVSLANPEAVVADQFAAALREITAMTADAQEPLVSGSEAYWLAKRRHDPQGGAIEPAAWSASGMEDVAVGDRITVSTSKAHRIYEVVKVDPVDAPAAENGMRQVSVTCREVGAPGERLTTFLATSASGPTARKGPRIL